MSANQSDVIVIPINMEPTRRVLDGTLLPNLVADYLADCQMRLTENTMVGYRTHMNRFLLWWKTVYVPKSGVQLGRRGILAYTLWLKHTFVTSTGEKLTLQGQCDSLRRLRTFLHWCFKWEYWEWDVSVWVDVPEVPSLPKPPLFAAQLRRLLDAAEASHAPVRDKAIISLLAGTGIRKEECASIVVGDVALDNKGGTVYIRKAKMGKSRYVVLDEKTAENLSAWLRKSVPNDRELLFGVGPKGIYDAVRSASERAGLRDTLGSPHALRRLFVTHWGRVKPGDGSMRFLQKQTGQSTPSMIQLYSRHDIEDVRKNFVSPMSYV